MDKVFNSDSKQEEQKIRGEVVRVRFNNPENNYYVFTLESSSLEDQIVVQGNASDLQIKTGAEVVVHGSFQDHPKYGPQFKASRIILSAPTTNAEIERYLASGIVKGIGKKTAERIVKTFGKDSLEIIRNSPGAVAQVAGVGSHKAQLLSEAFDAHEDSQEAMQFLLGKGLTPNLATKIYKKYKGETIGIVSQDPYRLSRDLHGVGFQTADEIALNSLNLPADSPQRLKAGVFYALEKARDSGHSYLPGNILIQRASTVLGLDVRHDLTPHIHDLEAEGFVVIDEERVYLKRLYTAEEFCAEFTARRCGSFQNSKLEESLIDKCIKSAESELEIEFSTEQKQAIHYATQYKLLIITGGPGCGKTTLIKGLTSVFSQAEKRILLAAPTGRAAQKMAAVCDMKAQTIHRMLRYDPFKRSFLYNRANPLEIDDKPVDVVILDESSMIDISLAKDLFSAIPSSATIILVGDKDQLPSVGPGRVFADLISLEDVKTVRLQKLFRRADESAINTIAHRINAGVPPEIPEPDGQTKTDAYFIPKRDKDETASLIEKLIADQIPRKFGIECSDISVLTPSNLGSLGTIALNKMIQNRINPIKSDKDRINLGDNEIRLGDKVCQRVNNYNIDPAGVFNGDVGIVTEVNRKEGSLVVELWDGRLINYNSANIHQLSLAYAITVHRSQGSEIPCVVLALNEAHYTLLERQLIYTAITRAKELLIVVGSKKALSIATQRSTAKKRLSFLRERILELLR